MSVEGNNGNPNRFRDMNGHSVVLAHKALPKVPSGTRDRIPGLADPYKLLGALYHRACQLILEGSPFDSFPNGPWFQQFALNHPHCAGSIVNGMIHCAELMKESLPVFPGSSTYFLTEVYFTTSCGQEKAIRERAKSDMNIVITPQDFALLVETGVLPENCRLEDYQLLSPYIRERYECEDWVAALKSRVDGIGFVVDPTNPYAVRAVKYAVDNIRGALFGRRQLLDPRELREKEPVFRDIIKLVSSGAIKIIIIEHKCHLIRGNGAIDVVGELYEELAHSVFPILEFVLMLYPELRQIGTFHEILSHPLTKKKLRNIQVLVMHAHIPFGESSISFVAPDWDEIKVVPQLLDNPRLLEHMLRIPAGAIAKVKNKVQQNGCLS